jgi:hypothetical protein
VTLVRAVVFGYSPTTTNNDNRRKPQTLHSRAEEFKLWRISFHGRPDSATLEWCSDPFETEQAAEELRDNINKGIMNVKDVQMWYLNGVEEGKE